MRDARKWTLKVQLMPEVDAAKVPTIPSSSPRLPEG